MTTVRLNKELEDQIEAIAQNEHITKSDVIKKALENYCATFYLEKKKLILYQIIRNIIN